MNNKKSRVKKQSIKKIKSKSNNSENINSEINDLTEIIKNSMNLSNNILSENKKIFSEEYKMNLCVDKELFSGTNVKENICEPDKSIEQKLINFDEDYIRPPDSVFKERLIDYNEIENDDELMMVINISMSEYYNSIKSNHINIEYDNISIEQHYMKNEDINDEDINNEHINNEHINNEHLNNEHLNNEHLNNEHINNEYLNNEHLNNEHLNNEHLNNEHIDQHNNKELLKALEISKSEQLKYEEYILNESIKLEKSKRIDSLKLFCKKIDRLIFTKEDLLIKNYIESVLEDYFSLKIDYINVDEDMYNNLYSVIDTYYLIPTIKNYKKTAITEIEDNLIRTIFRKQ